MRKVIFLSLVMLLSLVSQVWAQSQTISGVVSDAGNGQPLPGVNVVVKGTSIGTFTGANGEFTVDVPEGSETLVFSYLGYVNQDVNIAGKTSVNVALKEDSKALSEVVVIGYGTQEKRDITGSVASVKSEEIENLPVAGLDQAIQGRIAGVNVTSSSGTPGGGISVRVRGTSSISAGNSPLYVVDGVPVSNTDISQGGFGNQEINPLSEINPNDIESIEVLKDASSAAIYGSRGSNGVVLITTKKGKAGKTQVDIDAYSGVQSFTKKVDFLNSNEYVDVVNEARQNYMNDNPGNTVDLLGAPAVNTNWIDEITRNNAAISNLQVSVRGGNDKTRFYISGARFLQEGIILNNEYERKNLRLNLEHSISDKVEIGSNLGVSRSVNNRIIGDNSIFAPWPNALQSRPDQPAYNEDGTYFATQRNNPVQGALEPQYETTIFRVFGNVFGSYEIIPGLKYRLSAGGDWYNNKEFQYEPITSGQGFGTKGYGLAGNGVASNYLVENTIDYSKSFGELNLSALAGYTYQEFVTERQNVQGTDFPSASFHYITSAAKILSGTSTWTSNALESYLGRVNLDYGDKYLLSLAIRRDGASKFSEDNKYGAFPSVSVGWRLSQEAFMQQFDFLSDLKLRASYGITGNQEGIGDYAAMALITGDRNYNDQSGIAPSQLPNPDLRWEQTKQTNVGLDLGLFNNRISLGADYFIKQTDDLLLSRPLPRTSGYTSITENIGSVENKGFEFAITTRNFDGAFRWSTDFNIAFINNEVTRLNNNEPFDRGFVNRVAVGQPVGAFYLLEQVGIYQTDEEVPAKLYARGVRAGDVMFRDVNGDGDITTGADRTFVGSAVPDYFGGITNNFAYKGFDLSVFFQYSVGNEIYAMWKELDAAGNLGARENNNAIARDEAENRWTAPGTSNTVPRAIYGAAGTYNTQRSSRYLEDGSYLRLKTLNLGYSLPGQLVDRVGLRKVRVYATGQNLLTFTKYSGFDPEVSSNAQDAVTAANDQATLPQLRSFTLGVNIGF
ncbi:TonB-dependent receptor [Pontibacter diazotrophicus]|uniref:TonB-dependent receptor n=1 Tax=Pontibacter diazotrophicus TaxID=1400979 RepID=A0A3D8LE23_9BACT|nr:TonB-dependent receptor [Pontibacter diazotrophicus]RDV15647.1 TonB-dependent receptor [Pontibacter diazotrophicus]